MSNSKHVCKRLLSLLMILVLLVSMVPATYAADATDTGSDSGAEANTDSDSGSGTGNSGDDTQSPEDDTQSPGEKTDIPDSMYSFSAQENLVYNGSAQTLVTVTYQDGVTAVFRVNDVEVNAPVATNVGEYTVTAVFSHADYNSVTKSATVTIAAAAVGSFAFVEEKVALDYSLNREYTNTLNVSDPPGMAGVTYSSSNTDIATVDAGGKVTVKAVGTVTITAQRPEGNGFQAASAEYTLTIKKAAPELKFAEESPASITYAENLAALENAATGADNIVYTILSEKLDGADHDVADIDEQSGAVTVKSAGEITVQAAVAETEDTFGATATYTLTINRAAQTISFDDVTPTKTWSENGTYAQRVKDAKTEVTYKITSGEDVATLSGSTLTLLKAGSVTVKASAAQTACYEAGEATYTLTVNKADQAAFTVTAEAGEVAYLDTTTVSAEGGSGTGAVTYAVTKGAEYATVDSDGLVEAIKAGGTVTVTATKAADDCYNAATATCEIKTIKAEQVPIKFPEGGYSIYSGEELTISFEGGSGNGAVTYEVIKTENANVLQGLVDSIDALGVVTFKEYHNKIAVGTVYVKVTKAADENYNEATAETVIVITEQRAESLTVDAYSLEGTTGNDGWYTTAVTIKGTNGYKVSYGTNNKSFAESLVADTEGENTYTFYAKKGGGNGGIIAYKETLKIDTVAPVGTISYKYGTGDAILNFLTFGLYTPDETIVTITATDDSSGSGLYEIVYTYNGVETEVICEDAEEDSVEITVPTNEKAAITFKVYDNAGNVYPTDGDNSYEIITDSTAPVVTLTYAEDDPTPDGTYTTVYNAPRTATITVTETNFAEKDKDGNSLIFLEVTNAYGKAPTMSGWTTAADGVTHTATITFSEDGLYDLSFSCKDLAGNESNPVSDSFTVDQTAPVVTLTYAENDPTPDGTYTTVYNAPRTATITVTERNFAAERVTLTLANAYGAVPTMSGWTTAADGVTHTATITFSADGLYDLSFVCVDQAGWESNTVTDSFTVDQTAPVIQLSYTGDSADSTYTTFYNGNRIATITVTERNFATDRVTVRISNSDGTVPTMSGWSHSDDGVTHTATITYTADGDYTFSISCVDQAGWDSNKVSDSFTIDKTNPVVSVSYDNNEAQNGNYYKDTRTATITVTEHNFVSSRVTVTITATDDGAATTVPTVSSWTTSGNSHTATIYYSGDAKYTFDIAVRDKAGNDSSDFEQQEFYVDRTAPTLEITGVEDRSANSGEVIPVVTYSDTNLDMANVSITLTGANRKTVTLLGSYEDIHNGQIFTFEDFAYEKAVDDIYTLTAVMTDLAGNVTEQTITFSVNRFGSTYALSEETESINGTFIQEPIDIIVTETNPTELSNIKIILFKNNETIVLEEGEDYKIEVSGGNGKWYEYTYIIYSENFGDDGVYSLTLYSEDEAGNVAENTLDTKGVEINFGVDKTPPTGMVTNIEDGETYPVESITAILKASDNLKLTSVTVYLDGEEYRVFTGEEINEILSGNGEFNFDILGNVNYAHELRIVLEDAAGNVTEILVDGFRVTTNLFVRFYSNTPLFIGTIAVVTLGIAFLILLLAKKKKKEEEEAEVK